LGTLLQLENITKVFDGLVANDRISLDVREGEIHALLGENGAGKTTLMNILYGLYHPDGGRIRLRGETVRISSPKDAIMKGIGMVHQHFMLIPPLTVTENIILGMGSLRRPLLDLDSAAEKISSLSEGYGLNVDPRAEVCNLSVGAQQRVEIVKALYRGADLFILDEPTSVLTPQEVADLFSVLRRLVDEGHSVIFITHKLDEVMDISDRVTVLRDGRLVATVNTAETSKQELARMMVGREIVFRVGKEALTPGETVLEVSGLEVDMEDERCSVALQGMSLSVRRHEVLGIAGVGGNGQTELAGAVIGLFAPVAGKITILGHDVAERSTKGVIKLNVGRIPEDRQAQGLVPDFTISENLIATHYTEPPLSRRSFLNFPFIAELAKGLISEYDIRPPQPALLAKQMSGGNQQKLILARELHREPDLIVAVQPTRGLDVGATEYIYKELLKHRARGAAILLISTELEEIFTLSDRIAVMFRGEILGIRDAESADIEEIGLLMAGVRTEQQPLREMTP
jgi:simple sugar transport system ATP-binding protein